MDPRLVTSRDRLVAGERGGRLTHRTPHGSRAAVLRALPMYLVQSSTTSIEGKVNSYTTPDSRHAHPLDDADHQLRCVTNHLVLDEGMFAMLSRPRREMAVSIPLRRVDGSVEAIVGHRVQHNVFGVPDKGALA